MRYLHLVCGFHWLSISVSRCAWPNASQALPIVSPLTTRKRCLFGPSTRPRWLDLPSISSTFARAPWLALLLVAGLLLAFGALILRLQGMAFGEPSPGDKRSTASILPIAAHLGLVVLAGIYLPPPLVAWFQHVATMLR